MGDKNSTKTRVTPLMEALDGNVTKIKKFLEALPGIEKRDLDFEKIEAIKYGENEKALQANYDLLMWMVQHPDWMDRSKLKPSNMSEETYAKRRKLFDGDPEIEKEALEKLTEAKEKQQPTNQKWYAFEGPSYPDIYIETDTTIFIGEAKRSEPTLTRKTTWLHHRDQLIRHYDCALEKKKPVKVFYVFEKEDFEKKDIESQLENYKDDEYIVKSAPHRNISFAPEFRNDYVGYVFFEDLSKKFSVSFD